MEGATVIADARGELLAITITASEIVSLNGSLSAFPAILEMTDQM
jgi:hypothetical protein